MAENENPDVMYKLGRVESLVESLIKRLDDYITEVKSINQDHETRIKKLETSDTRRAAIAVTLGTIGGLVSPIIIKVLFHV